MFQIRSAQAADAKALAELAERTFRATFEAVNTPENVRLHCTAYYGEAQQAREIADPNISTLLCDQHGELIGYTQLHWDAPQPALRALQPAEIRRLYVDAGWHGP